MCNFYPLRPRSIQNCACTESGYDVSRVQAVPSNRNVIREIKDLKELGSATSKSSGLVLVAFYLPGSAVSKAFIPELEKIQTEFEDNISFIQVNLDILPTTGLLIGLSKEVYITSNLTLLYIKNNEVIHNQLEPKLLDVRLNLRKLMSAGHNLVKSSSLTKVSSIEEYEKVISKGLVVTYFGADWCPDCRALEPQVIRIEQEYKTKFNFFKVDVDELQDIAIDNEIYSIPTLFYFNNGVLISRQALPSPHVIRETLNGILDDFSTSEMTLTNGKQFAIESIGSNEVTTKGFTLIESPEEYEKLSTNGLVVSFFTAKWCSYCHALEPHLLKIEKEYGDNFNFLKVDFDKLPSVIEDNEITGIPTLIYLNDGEVITRQGGPNPHLIRETLDKVLKGELLIEENMINANTEKVTFPIVPNSNMVSTKSKSLRPSNEVTAKNITIVKSSEDYERLSTDGLVVSFFTAEWCPYCRALEPHLSKIEQEYGNDFNFIKVDIDQLQSVAAANEITHIPTLFYLNDGEIISKQVGPNPHLIRETLDKILKGEPLIKRNMTNVNTEKITFSVVPNFNMISTNSNSLNPVSRGRISKRVRSALISSFFLCYLLFKLSLVFNTNEA